MSMPGIPDSTGWQRLGARMLQIGLIWRASCFHCMYVHGFNARLYFSLVWKFWPSCGHAIGICHAATPYDIYSRCSAVVPRSWLHACRLRLRLHPHTAYDTFTNAGESLGRISRKAVQLLCLWCFVSVWNYYCLWLRVFCVKLRQLNDGSLCP